MELSALIQKLIEIKGLLDKQGYSQVDVTLYHPQSQDIQVVIKGATITTATEMGLDMSSIYYYANGSKKLTRGDKPNRYNQPIVILEA